MITLQKSFSYKGKINESPVDRIRLTALFPVFDYIRSDTDDTNIEKHQISTSRSEATLALGDKEYSLSVPTSNLIGANDQATNGFLIYTANAFSKRNLNALEISIPIEFTADSAVFGSDAFGAYYFVKKLEASLNRPARTLTLRAMVHPELASGDPSLEEAIVLINKDAYEQALPDFKRISHRDDDFALLAVVAKFIEETALGPATPKRWDRQLVAILGQILGREGFREPFNEVIDFIRKTLDSLFDFPINTPRIDTLEVAGVLEVKTDDNSAIQPSILQLYKLSLEYATRGTEGVSDFHSLSYQWDNNAPVNRNRIPFSFFNDAQIIRAALVAPININVKTFDGTELWSRNYSAEDPALKKIEIAVSLVRPAILRPVRMQGIAATPKRLRGQVLTLTKECPLKDLTVVIQAKQEHGELWRVVAAATTDASGNFSTAYPYGTYSKAQAIVSLTPDRPADIPIRTSGPSDETIADDFLYLLITEPKCPETSKKADCDCDAPKKAPRLPEQTDLIGSDDYTQDIGGSCLNLSTPNRTLNEYGYRAIVRTSDPDVANYTLVKNPDGSFVLKGGQRTIRRTAVSLNNPIRWQDAPDAHRNLTLYQAVSVATGHVLRYRAVFKADGYSLGELLYSLALAPGQKKQIVVFDAAHSLQGAESQNIAQGERLAASLLNERSIVDQLSGNLNEAMSGSSSASTGGVSAGLGAGVTNGFAAAVLGVAGGFSSASSSASQNSSRDTSMFFIEKLRQLIMQNADSYRQLNASVVTTVKEGQQYAATTEVVANHNHCHALTMMYFEVLRHYAVYQEMTNVEECIFVPLLMTHFSQENIYKWQDVLARSLLPIPSNTYLQPFSFLRYKILHPLIPAFDANGRILTDYKHVDFPEGAFCDEKITSVTGYITLRVNIPRPKTIYDRVMSLPVSRHEATINKRDDSGIVPYLGSLLFGRGGETVTVEEKQRLVDEHIVFSDNINDKDVRPADAIFVVKFDKFFPNSKDEVLWKVISNICGYDNVEDFLANYFKHKTISQWDATFNDEIAPAVFEALVDNTILINPFSALDLTTVDKYHGGEQLMRLNFHADTSLARKEISSVAIVYSDKVSIPAFWHFVTFQVENLCINYTTKHYEGFIVNKAIGDSLYDNTDETKHPIQTPMNSDEQRNPKEEDQYLVRKLLEHLNSNIEYYNRALWHYLDPERRYMLLDGFGIQIYNGQGVSVGTRSLASVVRNELLTVTGNSLVFPIAAGYRVSQAYITERGPDGEAKEVSLLDHYKPLTPIPPYRISVPSRGVFLEAVQGACDACERVKENSSQDWSKFPTDEPTPVQPLTPPVPTVTDWKAAFKDFAPPLVNIQNAPAAPAPGAGLTGLTELLGKSGIFKDITGLDTTQQNAIRTYLSNQENAKAFAAMAKDLAMQEHNTQHSDKIMDALKSAKDSGALSQDEYGKLVKDHLQKQIDGGQAQSAADERAQRKSEISPIASAAELARTGNRSVSASESDSSGNTKTLEVKPGPPSLKYDFVVPGEIIPIKQPSENACWAAVATMLSNWRQQKRTSVDDYVGSIGTEYLPYVESGLPVARLENFTEAASLKTSYTNTSFPVGTYFDILQKHGPIWVIDLEDDDTSMLHGRLLIGIRGDDSSPTTMLTLIDPATGSKYDEDLPTFLSKTEAVVKVLEVHKDVEIPLLVYLKDTYDTLSFYTSLGGDAAIGAAAAKTYIPPRVQWYRPKRVHQLIVDGAECVDVGASFMNWGGLYGEADDVTWQKLRKSDRMFYIDEQHPKHGFKDSAEGYRLVSQISKIVLHETGFFGDNKHTIIDFGLAKKNKLSYRKMPHFIINRDGSIIQFLDVCEIVNHCIPLNETAIGIEFVNNPWGQESGIQSGTKKKGVDPVQIPLVIGVPHDKDEKYTYVYVPSKEQLEGLVTLLRALFNVVAPKPPILPALRQTWMNVININPKNKKKGKETLQDGNEYFILNNAETYLADIEYSEIKPNGWSTTTSGIYAHHLYSLNDHVDGMIPTLYSWLRIAKNIDPDNALKLLIKCIGEKTLRVSGGHGGNKYEGKPNDVTMVAVTVGNVSKL